MAKSKVRDNPKSMRLERHSCRIYRFLRKFLPGLLLSSGLGFIFFILFMSLAETPAERRLRKEKAVLSQSLEMIHDSLKFYDNNLNKIAGNDNYEYRVIADMDSIPERIRKAGYGGSRRYDKLTGREHSDLIIDVLNKLDILNNRLEVQNMSFVELSETLSAESERLRRLPVITPVHNDDLIRQSSTFGYRSSPFTGKLQFHTGVDFSVLAGKPVYAPGAGTVIFSGTKYNGYGKHIIIDHGINGISTLYAHLSDVDVKEGQTVERGEMIGTVGSTGRSTAPHLHYEIRIDDKQVNPAKYSMQIGASQYNALIENAGRKSEGLALK